MVRDPTGKCKYCGARVVFARGPNAKYMIFDADGQQAWILDRRGEALQASLRRIYVPHHATCPEVGRAREARAKTPEQKTAEKGAT